VKKVPRHNIGEANYTPETGVLAGVIPTPMRTGLRRALSRAVESMSL